MSIFLAVYLVSNEFLSPCKVSTTRKNDNTHRFEKTFLWIPKTRRRTRFGRSIESSLKKLALLSRGENDPAWGENRGRRQKCYQYLRSEEADS